jgi:hypothetical protein
VLPLVAEVVEFLEQQVLLMALRLLAQAFHTSDKTLDRLRMHFGMLN